MTERHLRAVIGGATDVLIDDHGEVDTDHAIIPSDYANLVDLTKQLLREKAALKARLTKLAIVDPNAEVIGELLSHWHQVCMNGHPRVKIPMDGARWQAAKARLRDHYTPEQLKQCIDVAAEMPWMEFDRRYSEPGPGRVKRVELTLLFRDEAHVDALLKLADDPKRMRSQQEYRRRLHGACKTKPGLVRALAFLADIGEPHGSVIAAAAVWAKQQEAR